MNITIEKTTACEWQQKVDQKSIDGSGFARLDIYDLRTSLNTDLVQYWLRPCEPLTEKHFNVINTIEFVPKRPEPAIQSLMALTDPVPEKFK